MSGLWWPVRVLSIYAFSYAIYHFHFATLDHSVRPELLLASLASAAGGVMVAGTPRLPRYLLTRLDRWVVTHTTPLGPGYCRHCRYDLRGTVRAGRPLCPECGTPIELWRIAAMRQEAEARN